MATKVFLENYKMMYDIDEKDEELCLLVKRDQENREYYIY